jgi:hypothetical protein
LDFIYSIADQFQEQFILSFSFQGTHQILQGIDFAITVYFVFEIILRISVLTPTVFFKEWYNMVSK